MSGQDELPGSPQGAEVWSPKAVCTVIFGFTMFNKKDAKPEEDGTDAPKGSLTMTGGNSEVSTSMPVIADERTLTIYPAISATLTGFPVGDVIQKKP